jgi:hypothetical protein
MIYHAHICIQVKCISCNIGPMFYFSNFWFSRSGRLLHNSQNENKSSNMCFIGVSTFNWSGELSQPIVRITKRRPTNDERHSLFVHT